MRFGSNPERTLRLSIGSGADSDITIDDPLIATRHVDVELLPGMVRLHGLQPDNGVFVNNRLVRSCTVLRSDRVRLGKSGADFWQLLDDWWLRLAAVAEDRTTLQARERQLASRESEVAAAVELAQQQATAVRQQELNKRVARATAHLPDAAWHAQPLLLSTKTQKPVMQLAVAFSREAGIEVPVLVPVEASGLWKVAAPQAQAATAWRLASQTVARLCVADPPSSWRVRVLDPFSRLAAIKEVAGLPQGHTNTLLEVTAREWLAWAADAQNRLVAFRRTEGRGIWNTRPDMWAATGVSRPQPLALTLLLHDGPAFFAGHEKVLAQWIRDSEDLGERLVLAGPPLEMPAPLELLLDESGHVTASSVVGDSPRSGEWEPIAGPTVLGWSDPEVQGSGREGSASLWDRSAESGLHVTIGQAATGSRCAFALADDTAAYHGLVGGTTGSGKTVLLHNLITGLAMRYAPWELELILADFKEGTEFKRYERLPHLRALCLTTDPEAGLGVLRHLMTILVERGRLFKQAGVANIESFRAVAPMPRILVVLDEFQVLLSGHGASQTEASNTLEDIVRRGRSFGVHLLLATQTLMDVELSSSTRSNLAVRIAFRLQSADASRLLVYDNDAPVHFRRPGEGLYNAQHGEVAGNENFQADYVSPEDLEQRLQAIDDHASGATSQAPNGWRPPPGFVLDEMQRPGLSQAPTGLVLGKPRRLTHEWFTLRIESQVGDNIAIVGTEQQLRQDAIEVLGQRLVALGHDVTWMEFGRAARVPEGIKLLKDVSELGATLDALEAEAWTPSRQAWLIVPQVMSLRARRDELMARPQLATAPATFELEPVTEEQPADDMAGVDTDDFEAFLAEHMAAALQGQRDDGGAQALAAEPQANDATLLERLAKLVRFGGARNVHVLGAAPQLQDLGEVLLDAYQCDNEFRHLIFVTADEAERHLGLQSRMALGTVVVADGFAGGASERVVLCDPKA